MTQPTSQSPVRFFDINAMTGPIATRIGPEGGVPAMMAQFGIEAAVVSHSYALRHDVATGNAMAVAAAADDPAMLPCWYALPDSCDELPEPKQWVAAADAAGVVAFRIAAHDHGFELLGADSDRLLSAISESPRPLLVDADQASWSEVEELGRRYPLLPVVVTVTGYRTLRSIAGALERHPMVHVDLSYLGSHQALEWLVERFGSGRVLFGTGFPQRDPADAVTRLLWSELDDTAVAEVAGGNLRRLLGGLLEGRNPA